MDKPSTRRLIVDRLLAALESIDAQIPIAIDLAADGTLIVRAGVSGKIAEAAKRSAPTAFVAAPAARRGRPPGRKAAAAQTAPDTSGSTDHSSKVMDVLGTHTTGLNLKSLAKAVGSRKKAALKPVLDQLIDDKKLMVVRNLYRRTDVTVTRGRKAAGDHEKSAAPVKQTRGKRGRPSASKANGKSAPTKRAGSTKGMKAKLEALVKARAAKKAKREATQNEA